MTRIFERLLIALALGSFGSAGAQDPSFLGPPAPPAPLPAPEAARESEISYQVVGATFTGLERTDRDWIESYLDYEWPARMTRDDARRVQRRLLTTAVFADVKVLFAPVPGRPDQHVLHVDVVERWTTIPVLRAVYGGGTPLRVLGAYDIHAFGRLLTLGGEAQQYGDAPIGSVFYAKSPRHSAGRYYLAAELWREFRRRPVYADSLEPMGTLSTDVAIRRGTFLSPLVPVAGALASYPWRAGIDVVWIDEKPAGFTPIDAATVVEPPEALPLGAGASSSWRFFPTLMYDDIDLSILDLDGFRLVAKGGPVYVSGTRGGDKSAWHGAAEVETFWYKLWTNGLNVGVHTVLGETSAPSLKGLYFLGGLDSVRGFPDGYVFGKKAAWANAEVRHVTWKPSRYAWVQTLGFCDAGGAAARWADVGESVIASCGAGVRVAIPQVNRMIFRIDYAWAVDGSGARGIAAGMNQFFDPYKPLSDR